MSAATFALTFTPTLSRDGMRYDGPIETVTVGRYADVARAWRKLHRHYFRGIGGTDDPRRYRTIPGASSANGRRVALYVIGRGMMEIHEVAR